MPRGDPGRLLGLPVGLGGEPPVAGHQLAELLRGVFSWGQQASDSFVRQLDEFIHFEAQLAPSRLEVEDFYADLRQLDQRVERLQARLRHLRTRHIARLEL